MNECIANIADCDIVDTVGDLITFAYHEAVHMNPDKATLLERMLNRSLPPPRRWQSVRDFIYLYPHDDLEPMIRGMLTVAQRLDIGMSALMEMHYDSENRTFYARF